MIQPIYEFIPPAIAVKEIWCAKCKNHRPEFTSVVYRDGNGRRKHACESCRKYVKGKPR